MKLISQDNPSDFNQAIMEFGALICKPATPSCSVCSCNDQCYELPLNEVVFDFPFKRKTKKSINRFFNYLVSLQNSKSRAKAIKKRNLAKFISISSI